MKSNGRIDLLHAPNPISLYDKPVYTSSYKDAMTGNWVDTPLSIAFFSQENQQILQNGIRAGVYKMSGNKSIISQQSNPNLKIIMRAIFLEHSKNNYTNIRNQIEILNQHVLKYSIPRIYGETQGYLKYLQDASTLVVPLSNPISMTLDKTLELKPFF
jgi:hypothetical protein